MMEKQKIMDMIQECIKTEESAIPLYAKHLGNTLFLSGFKEDERRRIKEILRILLEQSEMHKRKYKGIFKKIRTSNKNVY